MKHLILAILILFLNVNFIHAQSPSLTDSLLQQLKTATDTSRVNVLLALCKDYRRSDVEKSIRYGEEAIALARKLDFTGGITLARQHLSNACSDKGDYLRALNLRLELLEEHKKADDMFNVGRTLHTIGAVYQLIGNYPMALDYYFNSARMKEKIDDEEGVAKTLYQLGSVYEEQNNDTLALKYFLQSLNTYKKIDNYSGLAIVSTSIGQHFQRQNNYKQALLYFQNAYEASKKIPSPEAVHAIATSLLNVSAVYKDSLNYEKALAYNAEVLKIAHQYNNSLIEALSLENSARIYLNMGQLPKSSNYFLKALAKYSETGSKDNIAKMQNALAENYFRLHEFQQAEQYASNSLQIADEAGMQLIAKEALEILIKINSATGNYAKAFNYQRKYLAVKDSLLNQEKSKEITQLEMLYETEKKEKEITLLKSKAEKEEIFRYVIGGGALFISILAFFLYNQQRTKNQKSKQLYASHQALARAELNNARLNEIQLQKELEFKAKELTTSALNLIQKNSLMQEIKDKIREIQSNSDQGLSKELNKLQHIVDHSFNLDDDWKEFRMYFELVHHDFLSNLKKQFPGLTNKELRLSALLRLNLNIKETTTLLGISAESVKVARYRLRKKLRLSADESLTDFLMHIENGNTPSNGSE